MCLMGKQKIIIVEDDTVLRDLYLRKFKTDVYDVRTASNGQDALDLVSKEVPDLMLLDLNMPVMDGFTVLQTLTKEKRSFPIIILTNFDDQVSRERGMALGGDDYFVKKNMTIKSLLEMVEKLLAKKTTTTV